MELVLTKRFGKPNSHLLATYEADGGYQAARKALAMTPEEVVAEVKKANLRGRGGAGFPAGVKWSFMPKEDGRPHFLCVNADEGEPGTFKDRALMRHDPHQLLEGIIIASHAIRADYAMIYVRGEMWDEKAILMGAIKEARARGYFGKGIFGTAKNLHCTVVTGAGAYICGEETAMINSMEGKRGEPRLKPPFPAQVGAFGMPSTVNNVETISNAPHILGKGGEWFTSLGLPNDGGTRLFGVSGNVKKPGIYELPQGFNLKKLIFEVAGGLKDGKTLRAVIPGGSSCPVLRAEEIDIPHSYDSMRDAGTMAGSAGVIVLTEDQCMVKAMENLAHFYSHESCGQCTPCREGTHWLHLVIRRIERGQGEMKDLDDLLDICGNMIGTTICPLSDAAAMPMRAFVQKFRDEFEAHIKLGRCPKDGRL
ncbi:MAG: NADH oxidoreductase (quinone) subunit F [Myxococcales bacterium]|nr:MAG: NADH oxidoreductase (quinone) subunit F [Myxococcales bacterium]